MKRGEIYLVDLGPPIGRELGGPRPVVVVSSDVFNAAPMRGIVVIGFEAGSLPGSLGTVVSAPLSGLATEVVFWPTQVRVLDPQRFPASPAGIVPTDLLAKIVDALKGYLDL